MVTGVRSVASHARLRSSVTPPCDSSRGWRSLAR
jgi:hypothetical protein